MKRRIVLLPTVLLLSTVGLAGTWPKEPKSFRSVPFDATSDEAKVILERSNQCDPSAHIEVCPVKEGGDVDFAGERINFAPDNEIEVSAAKASFEKLKKEGYAAHKVDSHGEKGELAYNNNFDPHAGRIFMAQAPTTLSSDLILDDKTRVETTFMYGNNGKTLENITLTFAHDDWDKVKEVFILKYGHPTEIRHQTLQNGFGATFHGEELIWSGSKVGLVLLEYNQNLNSSFGNITTLSHLDKKALEERKKTKAATSRF